MAPILSTLSHSIATASDIVDDNIIQFSAGMIAQAAALYGKRRRASDIASMNSRCGRKARTRERRTVQDQYRNMGPKYFRRAYRMEYESFWRLHDLLEEGIERARLNQRGYEVKGGREGGTYLPPPIPNGRIDSFVRLACALRYFVGGSPYDIMGKYGISYSEVLQSVWYVVDAVNKLRVFDIKYPESADEQRKIERQLSGLQYLCRCNRWHIDLDKETN